jgi:hypothetical protein
MRAVQLPVLGLTRTGKVTTYTQLRNGAALRWILDPEKDRKNRNRHAMSFATAQLVFEDKLAVSLLDAEAEEERWQTVGMIAGVIIPVVHTSPSPDPHSGKETGRIISARKATSHERKAYEEGAF